ncbi:MAG: transposase, partial [Spirochaetales bacterium]|nr:transposase [Spirochaetales bacterium]
PHLHVVIPSGCLSEDKTEWNPSHPAFLLPVRKLSAASSFFINCDFSFNQNYSGRDVFRQLC